MNENEERTKKLNALRKKFLNEPNFQKAACREAMNFVIIKRCRECYGPVIDGYCCNNCGSDLP